MAPAIKRNAIIVNLVAFVGFGVFCVVTHAPMIQQNVLKRCQDTLLMHGIPIEGLSVDGRDVLLRGAENAPITSAATRSLLSNVSGVRVVEVAISVRPRPENERQPEPDNSAAQRELQDKIDRVLENQNISFVTDSTVLTPASEKVLKDISSYLTDVPSLRCEIRVYDSRPRESRQSAIKALQLALAAEDYLVSQGVEEWRLSTHAYQIGEGQAGEGTEGERKRRPMDFIVRAR